MMRLKNVLSDSCKLRRRRRNLINIHITFLGWLVESFGFILILLGSFILGHSSPSITLILQTLTIIVQTNILPLVFLINDPELKANIVDSRYYLMFLNCLNLQKNSQNKEPGGEENSLVRED